MRIASRTLAAVVTTGVLVLSGCAGPQGEPTGGSGTKAAPAAESPSAEQATEPSAVTVDVTIRGGEVTPAGERVDVTAGEPIVLRVSSDQPDEIHVHSQPERAFEVRPTESQTFRFTISRPGVYEVESHETETVIASLAVLP